MDLTLATVAIALALLLGGMIGSWWGRRRQVGDETHQRDHVARLSQEVSAIVSRDLARDSREDLHRQNEQDGELRQKAIAEMLKPVQRSLDKLQDVNQKLHRDVSTEYGKLIKELGALQQATLSLDRHSHALTTALKGSSQARGRWGELALRNIAEMAGMTKHCDFEEQQTGDDGLRPDMVVRLPEQRVIPVDAKTSAAAYFEALEAEDPAQRTELMRKHARDMRARVNELAKKSYGDSTPGHIGHTIMFVPSDALVAAAYEVDPNLQEYAMDKQVLIATPVTFMALLRTSAMLWTLAKEAEHAQEVWGVAREFHDRVAKFVEHLENIGKGLGKALKSYNGAVGSYNRVLRQGRRIEELEGPTRSHKRLPDLTEIEGVPREPARPSEPTASAEEGAAEA